MAESSGLAMLRGRRRQLLREGGRESRCDKSSISIFLLNPKCVVQIAPCLTQDLI